MFNLIRESLFKQEQAKRIAAESELLSEQLRNAELSGRLAAGDEERQRMERQLHNAQALAQDLIRRVLPVAADIAAGVETGTVPDLTIDQQIERLATRPAIGRTQVVQREMDLRRLMRQKQKNEEEKRKTPAAQVGA